MKGIRGKPHAAALILVHRSLEVRKVARCVVEGEVVLDSIVVGLSHLGGPHVLQRPLLPVELLIGWRPARDTRSRGRPSRLRDFHSPLKVAIAAEFGHEPVRLADPTPACLRVAAVTAAREPQWGSEAVPLLAATELCRARAMIAKGGHAVEGVVGAVGIALALTWAVAYFA